MTVRFLTTALGADPVRVEGYFAATPDDVFDAWTNPERVMQWFGPTPNSLHAATIDLRVGGAWQFVKSSDADCSFGFEGTYLTIEPNARLVFTWSKYNEPTTGSRETSERSQVDIVFMPKGHGTQVTLVHSAVSDELMRKGFGGGWETGFANLVALFET